MYAKNLKTAAKWADKNRYEYKKLKMLLKAYHATDHCPLGPITLLKESLTPYAYDKRRTGQPKIQWVVAALEQYWCLVKHGTKYAYEELHWHDPVHLGMIRIALDKHYLPHPTLWDRTSQLYQPSKNKSFRSARNAKSKRKQATNKNK